MVFVKGQVTNPAGAKRGNQNAKGGKANLKHGYYSLVKIIRNRRGALDRRTILGKMVLETARQLEADLGGDLSTAEKMLVADVALDTLLLQALNNEVASAKPLIDGKNGLQAHPVYHLRSMIICQRREHLKLLGIKRVPREMDVHALDRELLAEKANQQSATETAIKPEVWQLENGAENEAEEPTQSGNGSTAIPVRAVSRLRSKP